MMYRMALGPARIALAIAARSASILLLAACAIESAVAGDYYAGIDASSPSALRTSLHELIDDHQRYPYTSSATDTWDILELADEDPLDPTRVRDLYRNESYLKAGGGNTDYNREHTWPSSYGFPTDNSSNYPYTDTHHLRLSNDSYNSSRGNKPFGLCSPTCTERPTTANGGVGGGSGTFPGWSNWFDAVIWQVWAYRKGDVARGLFYLDVRYEGGTHGIAGAAEPDLVLTDQLALIQTTGSNTTGIAYMGLLATLLAWHADDPPDEHEVLRNDVVQSFQGNRNPFVDHPEWVACLWLGTCAPPDAVFADGFES